MSGVSYAVYVKQRYFVTAESEGEAIDLLLYGGWDSDPDVEYFEVIGVSAPVWPAVTSSCSQADAASGGPPGVSASGLREPEDPGF
jgi:hypothetical protein